ncbi:hypothetical protein [Paenibacillus alvei]|uniref:Uncharacterized protein n=1 Tax=Paenibacillus alvei TaxID=44250 RepID=A0A383RAE3_PAEAL|nr:hypothetical protein [Paenibacillus alvei]SYX83930.1 protein of unknown function [Paenibacillus alvei]
MNALSEPQRLAFTNTYTNVTHSVIDFYSANVEEMLLGLRSRNAKMNGVSGFFDPDGNSLAVCSAVHHGQVNKQDDTTSDYTSAK